MNKTAHSKRKQRRHKKGSPAALNLTSLMDIFTILVFFLLVNSSDNQQLPDSETVTLPSSTAEKLPEETLMLLVSDVEILVQGQLITTVGSALAQEERFIPELLTELEYQASKSLPVINEDGSTEREITIMMDQAQNFGLLDRIMRTCMRSEYSKISFAVLRDAKDEEADIDG